MRRPVFLAALVLLAGIPSSFGQADLAERAEAAFVASFAGGDPAVFLRAGNQDEVQRLCSEHRNVPPAHVAEAIERFQRAAIRYPASLSGDWREGQRIAEDFTGMRYGDPRGRPNGGNCYACHQVEARELAYGTLGPSLLGYGKTRGWGVGAQRLAYERIYNSQAFTACSAMPRFGHNGVLTPEQIAHLVALLLDPTSPVNR
jgi:L-cysteine S-thiosulfotransferase